MTVVHLADYQPAPYLLERTDLTVRLFADHALVEARMAFLPGPGSGALAGAAEPLELRGVDLELRSLELDGVPLAPDAYRLEGDRLLVLAPPQQPFVITSAVRLDPRANTTLEGL